MNPTVPNAPAAASDPERSAAARVALLLAGAMTALPFLLPEHGRPITSFYDEWLAFALGAGAIMAFCLRARRARTAVPEVALWILALAAWVGIQALLRKPAYLELPLAGIVYLAFAAALAWLGRSLVAELGAQRVVDSLAGFLLAGATLNALIGIVQFYGVPEALDSFVATPSGPSAVGHVAQRNVYASYLAIGEASLLYLLARRRVTAWAARMVGPLLVIGSAYSGSRGAVLFSFWLVAIAWFAPVAGENMPSVRRASILLAAGTLVAIAALPALNEALGISVRSPFALARLAGDVAAGLAGAVRPAIWAHALRLASQWPWLGVGWGEFAGAASAGGLPHRAAVAYELWSSPHNVFLHLLAEAGVPALLLALAAAGRWTWFAARSLRTEPALGQWWATAAVGVVGVHSLVEFPLWSAHVLALASLVAGIGAQRALSVPAGPLRLALAAGCIALVIMLGRTLVDYTRFANAYAIAPGRTLASAGAVARAVQDLRSVSRGPLAAYAEPWLFYSLPLDATALDEKVALGARVLRRQPTSILIARYAGFLALAGRTDEAMRLTEHALATLPKAPRQFEATLRRAGVTEPAIAELLTRVRELGDGSQKDETRSPKE